MGDEKHVLLRVGRKETVIKFVLCGSIEVTADLVKQEDVAIRRHLHQRENPATVQVTGAGVCRNVALLDDSRKILAVFNRPRHITKGTLLGVFIAASQLVGNVGFSIILTVFF